MTTHYTVGSIVQRKTPKLIGPDENRRNEVGTVVAVTNERIQVQWHGCPEMLAKCPGSNYLSPKKTWMKISALIPGQQQT